MPLGSPDPRLSVRCRGCMTLVDQHHRFCPACGVAQGEIGAPVAHGELACPGCAEPLDVWSLDPRLASGSTTGYRGVDPRIHGCRSCGGAWVDRKTLEALIREASAIVDTVPSHVPIQPTPVTQKVIYRRCPSCHELMNRRNFAWISGIIIDECPGCGSFFDAGELEGMIAFVRAGGLTLARAKQAQDPPRVNSRLAPMPMIPEHEPGLFDRGAPELALILGFLRWVGRWLRDTIERGLGTLERKQ